MSSRRFSNFAISAVDDDDDDDDDFDDDGTLSEEPPPPPAGNDGAPPALLLSEPIDLSIFFVCLFANERTNERTTTERAFWCEENEFQSLIFVTINIYFSVDQKIFSEKKRRKSATTT